MSHFIGGAKLYSARTIKVKDEDDIRYYMTFSIYFEAKKKSYPSSISVPIWTELFLYFDFGHERLVLQDILLL